MNENDIDVMANLINAISILNKTDQYLDSLYDRLSKCDSLISDYEHFIENTPIEMVNLKKLYQDMQNNFIKRRNIKNNITINDNYKNLTSRLNNSTNREFLIQNLKNVQSKLGVKYHNRILTSEEVEQLKGLNTARKRGRPRKLKEGV